MAPYKYENLNEGLKEIRLLTLHEGDVTADIEISIHTVCLNPDSPPVYEALSYVWGSEENQSDVKVQIEVGFGTLTVTWNLAQALTHLRYSDRPRVLWVDAICVNQQNEEERGLQVKRMAGVYELADRVVAFLGPRRSNSDDGMKILENLGFRIKCNWVNWTTDQVEPAPDDANENWSDRNGEKELLAIHEVLKYPWFERLWVQQEIGLANNNATLMCGLKSIPWQSFHRAIRCLASEPWSIDNNIRRKLQARVLEVKNFFSNEPRKNFIDTMYRTKQCKCKDPRDRVFAILSLLNESDKAIGIEATYTKTTSQVYQATTERIIDHQERLEILRLSGLNDKPSEIPTWVSDWTAPGAASRLLPALASGFSRCEGISMASGVLSVTGTNSATIGSAEKIECNDYNGIVAEVKRLAPFNTLKGSYVGSCSLLEAYCRTIFAGHFDDYFVPSQKHTAQFHTGQEFLAAFLRDEKQQVPEDAENFMGNVYVMCKNRSFIQTREGYIGLAPRLARPGDQVCVLLGCSQPLLLRPAPNRQYQVVGECYMYGLMNGEAFLGPLPDHYRAVNKYQERGRFWWRGFLNSQTGLTQYIDPRLETPLEEDGEGVYLSLRNPDGSRSRGLTAEFLEKRGVKMQTFDLI